jgi:valyl-tRNA synthetase
MSKSFGNVIDPLPVMDELGTDALRFTLLVGSTPGNDMNLSLKKVEANRNFANKIWNAGRFVIGSLAQAPTSPPSELQWTLADSWIWARLQALIEDVARLFDNYQYGEAGRQIYDFFWGEFADWYLEIAKLQLAEGGERAFTTVSTLVRVLDLCLRLLHPFTPFITEELWGHLRKASQAHSSQLGPAEGWPEALMIAPWPETRQAEGWEAEKVADFSLLQEVVRAIRNLRSEKNVKPSLNLPAILAAGERAALFQEQASALAALAKLDEKKLQIVEQLEEKPAGHVALVVGPVEIHLPLAGLVDEGEERARLSKDLQEAEAQIKRLETLLASPFAEKAPPPVVHKEREKLAAYQETANKLRTQLEALG